MANSDVTCGELTLFGYCATAMLSGQFSCRWGSLWYNSSVTKGMNGLSNRKPLSRQV